MSTIVDQGLKDRIIEKLKNEGLTVGQASKEFGISKNTIYGWLHRKAGGDPSVLEISKLRRENKELKEIIGTLALDSERRKKNS
jgi:transposase